MQLGLVTYQWGADWDLSTVIENCEKTGFAGVELRSTHKHGVEPSLDDAQRKAVAQRLSGVTDMSKRAALAQQLLGRAGTRLLPLMEDGAQGIEDLQRQARALGLTISGDMAKRAALLTDTLNILRRVLQQGAVVIGHAVAPVIVKVTARITKIATKLIGWVKANRELVVTFLKVGVIVAAVGLSLITLGLGISIIATALVDTGSRADEFIFQEFKGTGNMELALDRDLANLRIWPAMNIRQSGTRKEEKLLPPAMLEKVWGIRRRINNLPPAKQIQMLLAQMKPYPDMETFLQNVAS